MNNKKCSCPTFKGGKEIYMELSKWQEENQDCGEKYSQETGKINYTECFKIQNIVGKTNYTECFKIQNMLKIF